MAQRGNDVIAAAFTLQAKRVAKNAAGGHVNDGQQPHTLDLENSLNTQWIDIDHFEAHVHLVRIELHGVESQVCASLG